MSITNVNISQDIYEFSDHELFCYILIELQRISTHLSLITDHEIKEEDIVRE